MGETTAYIILHENADQDDIIYKSFASDPGCTFGGSGVVFGEDGLCPLPNMPYDALCPSCGAPSFDDIEEALSEIDDIIPDFKVTCSACRKVYGILEINKCKSNWFIARNYIFISDIDPEEWEDKNLINIIKTQLPNVVEIVIGWDT